VANPRAAPDRDRRTRPPRARSSITRSASLQTAARDSPAGCQEVRQIRRLAQARVAISNRPPAPATPTTGSPHRRRQAPANAAAAGKLLLALRSLAAPGPRVAAAAFRAHTLSSAPAVCGPISSGRTIATTRPRSTNLGSACVRSPRPCAASTQRSSPRSRSPRPTRRRQRWWTTTSPSQARPPSYRLGRGGTPRDGSPTPSRRSDPHGQFGGPRPGRRGLAHPREAKAGMAESAGSARYRVSSAGASCGCRKLGSACDPVFRGALSAGRLAGWV
jgi:hypothetical protein